MENSKRYAQAAAYVPDQPTLDGVPTPKDEALQRLDAIKRQFPKFDPANYPKAEPLHHETTEVPL